MTHLHMRAPARPAIEVLLDAHHGLVVRWPRELAIPDTPVAAHADGPGRVRFVGRGEPGFAGLAAQVAAAHAERWGWITRRRANTGVLSAAGAAGLAAPTAA